MLLPDFLRPGTADFSKDEDLVALKIAGKRIVRELAMLGAPEPWIESVRLSGAVDARGRYLSTSDDYTFAPPWKVTPLESRLALTRWLIEEFHRKITLENYPVALALFYENEGKERVILHLKEILDSDASNDAPALRRQLEEMIRRNSAGAHASHAKDYARRAESVRIVRSLLDQNADFDSWDSLLDLVNARLEANGLGSTNHATFKKYIKSPPASGDGGDTRGGRSLTDDERIKALSNRGRRKAKGKP